MTLLKSAPSSRRITQTCLVERREIRFSACGADISVCVRQRSHYVLRPIGIGRLGAFFLSSSSSLFLSSVYQVNRIQTYAIVYLLYSSSRLSVQVNSLVPYDTIGTMIPSYFWLFSLFSSLLLLHFNLLSLSGKKCYLCINISRDFYRSY